MHIIVSVKTRATRFRWEGSLKPKPCGGIRSHIGQQCIHDSTGAAKRDDFESTDITHTHLDVKQ
eukprot:m.244548 g.244548  ORF g.244548 m.244548 type:complete len:64 (+) comp54089_c0_seq1:70-261(+)